MCYNRNREKRAAWDFRNSLKWKCLFYGWHTGKPTEHCGKELTDEELENLDFDIFSRLMIKIDWKDYPDQTERLERQAERIAENKEKKKQREKKNKKKVWQ